MKKTRKICHNDLKSLLEKVLTDFPPVARKGDDPVQFPGKMYENRRSNPEVEAAAIFAAMLSYGSARQFIAKINQVMQQCSWNYLELITSNDWENFAWPTYRLSTGREIAVFARATGLVIQNHGSLKKVFLGGYLPELSIRSGLKMLHSAITSQAEKLCSPLSRGIRHLLPDPASGGCAKRWQMFLRWMVRREDGLDMGIWPEVSPAHLIIPLDRHISRISRNLGLTQRSVDDWKTAEEITARLREFCPEDPIKYDFSLCHLGIAGKCTHGKDARLCAMCLLSPACAAAPKNQKTK